MTGIERTKAYELGIKIGAITAFCEAAHAECKNMSLSGLFPPEDHEFLSRRAEAVATQNEVRLYLEKDFLSTDLFPDADSTGKWLFVIYKKPEFLEAYNALKQRKKALVQQGAYLGNARKEIARSLGRLLGYSESYIEEKLRSGRGSPL